ncbi:MAG TPA: ATP synthase F1 subunit epsilon [Aliidongia sp.]|nr:ATP synthase F1 subunit epsilon [Aliidongia sp.]
MAGKVNFELVSPARILVSEAVDMVVIPGAEGDFGVLPNHAPLISSIRPGTIAVYEGSAVVERIFIAGGFAEVTPDRCTVLADEAVNVTELDRGAAEAEQRAADAALAGYSAEGDTNQSRLHALQRAQAVAAAKLQAFAQRAEH